MALIFSGGQARSSAGGLMGTESRVVMWCAVAGAAWSRWEHGQGTGRYGGCWHRSAYSVGEDGRSVFFRDVRCLLTSG